MGERIPLLTETGRAPLTEMANLQKDRAMTPHPFRIETQRLKDGPITHDLDLSPEESGLNDDPEFEFNTPVTGRLKASLIGKDVYLSGEVATSASCPCARCLEPMGLDLKAKVTLIYMQDDRLKDPDKYPELQDDNTFWYDGEFVYPVEQLRELLLLQLPPVVSCELTAENVCPVRGVKIQEMVWGDLQTFHQEEEAEDEEKSFAAKMKKLRSRLEGQG